MADRIRLTGIAATGRHGVLPEERRDGQRFVADVVLHVDTREAAAGDRLDATVDYGTVAVRVAEILTGEPADLIETVAERIAAAVLAHPAVHGVDVTVHKPQAPIPVPFEDVTVEIHRDRSHVPAVPAPAVLDLTSQAGAHAAPVAPVAPAAPTAPATPGTPLVTPVVTPLPPVGPVPGAALAAPVPVPSLADLVVPDVASLPGADVPAVPALVPDGADDPGTNGAPAHGLAANGTGRHAAPGADPDEPAGPVGPGADVLAPRDRMDEVPPAPVQAVLALGSNLGASQDVLRAAIRSIGDVPGVEVTAVGPLARTAAVGGPEQPDFLNTVVLVRTTLSPRALLRACLEIEAGLGRVREERWGPRTVDIDVIVHGSTIGVTDDLELPHPRAHERAFVLVPWAHVDPDAVLAGLGGGPVAALAETAPDRAGIRWVNLDWWTAV